MGYPIFQEYLLREMFMGMDNDARAKLILNHFSYVSSDWTNEDKTELKPKLRDYLSGVGVGLNILGWPSSDVIELKRLITNRALGKK